MNDLKRKNLRRLNIWPQLAHDYLAKLQQVIQGQKDDELAIRFYANGKNGNQVLVIVDATFLALHKIRPDFKVPAKSFAYMFNLPAPAMAFGKIKLPTAENVSLPYDDVLAKKVLPILRPQIEQQIAQVLAQIEQDFNIAPITVNPPSETYQEMDVVQSTL